MIFPRVTPKNPCPICKHGDWCQFGDYAIKCMRVESQSPARDGGWYHAYGDRPKPPVRYVPSVVQAMTLNAELVMAGLRVRTEVSAIKSLADSLNVSEAALRALGTAYASEHGAWAFPMRDADGNDIGIRLRNNLGKWAVKGSRQGIFLPDDDPHGTFALLPEGPTDTAAGLTLGIFTIGRPTCETGNDLIKAALRRLGFHRAVVVMDNDELKRNRAREWRPGLRGAQKLKKELGIKSVIWTPPSPIKDLREFVRKGGTAEMIINDVMKKVWTK